MKVTDKLNWSKVTDDFDEVDKLDDGVFYGLEEIDGYDVDKSDGLLKFIERPAKSENKQIEIKNQDAAVKPVAKEKKKSTKKQKAKVKPQPEERIDFNLIKAAPTKQVITSLGEWPELSPILYTALKELGFEHPTEIQKQAIGSALEGKDIIGKARTGSGKTLAFGLPIIENYIQTESKNIQGLIIAPTRELAHQIGDHLNAVISKCEFEDTCGCVTLTGGLAFQKQLRLLERNPIIVVATPGRLFDLLDKMPAKQLQGWQEIPTIVLDEADRLVQANAFEELEKIYAKIGRARRQTMVFSATFQPEYWNKLDSHKKRANQDIRAILQAKLSLHKTALFIDADPSEAVASAIVQSIMECPAPEKDLYLYYFTLIYPGKTIVFVNSIDAVKRVTPLLKELGQPAFGVHSEMIQKQRLRAIERFKATPNAILLATDVAARGLDVPLVDHVIHYNLPRTADTYVHRSGRTARAGQSGVSLMVVSPQEASTALPKLCKLVKTKPVALEVEYTVLDALRERVSIAKKIADAMIKSTSESKAKNWEKQAAEDLGIEVSDDEEEARPQQRKLGALRAQLRELLAQKIGPRRRYLTSGSVNLANEMLKNPTAIVAGRAATTALESLTGSKKARVKAALTKGQMQQIKERAKSQKRQRRGNDEMQPRKKTLMEAEQV